MTSGRWLAVASWYRAFFVGSCAITLFSCRKGTAAVDGAGSRGDVASARAMAPGADREGGTADAGGYIPATQRTCRVMALRGVARGVATSTSADPERLPLARGDLVSEGTLVELDDGSDLTVQATASAREITVVGPARAEACPNGDEALRLVHGKVTGFPGAGVRPGADVWIATALGVVRFSNANIEIAVPRADAIRLEIRVVTGQATFVPVAGVVPDLKTDARAVEAGTSGPEADPGRAAAGTLTEGEAIDLAPGVSYGVQRREDPVTRWSSDLVAACVRRSAAARQAADLLAAPRDAGRALLADLAFAHVKARQQARAACESAWTAGWLSPGFLDAARRSQLSAADATWKGAPAPPGAYQLTPLPARR